MADEVYHTRTGPSWASWLALILSIAALTLAWMAYNRAGENLEDQAVDAVESTTQGTENAADEAGNATQEGIDNVERGIDTGPDGVDDGTE